MSDVTISRKQFVELSNAGFQIGNYEIAEKLLIVWLKSFPNDLWMRYRLAIVLFKLGKFNDAIRLSELIVDFDPEFTEVWRLLSVLYPDGSNDRNVAKKRIRILSKNSSGSKASGNIGFNERFSLKSLFRRKSDDTTESIEEIDDFDILSALRIAKDPGQQADADSYTRLMHIYLRRWPRAIQFRLLFGDFQMRTGAISEGAKLIHATVENDLLGMVAERLWGKNHPHTKTYYCEDDCSVQLDASIVPNELVKLAKLESLFPSSPTIAIAPEEIASAGGSGARDSLVEAIEPGGETLPDPVHVLDVDETTIDDSEAIESGLNAKNSVRGERKEAILTKSGSFCDWIKGLFKGKKPTQEVSDVKEFVYKLDVENADERFPVYVVLSTIGGLTAKYGKNNKDFIGREMQAVANAVDNREGWNAMVFYPDEFASNIRAYTDPILIKSELVKLDQKLSEKGSMIGAVLIVGGHEVVPFFSMKNPAMDDDLAILSDTPYGTFDSVRIYDQQWQVGRIPGDSSTDPGLLLSQLRSIQTYHENAYEREIHLRRKNRKTPHRSFRQFSKSIKEAKTFGLSAAAWARASVAVYRNLSDASDLMLSPAVTAKNFPSSKLESIRYAYFNLHGIKGNPNWYGQKDPRDTTSMMTLPLAVQISNLDTVKKTPEVVFAENCYGAEIDRRSEANAISLHMLGKGTRVFVGSTAIAYGAMSLPLTAADLLAHLFWQHLRTGISTGEAFRRAKKNFATETEIENGGLDGEIQKTLISFVFYGDPLFAVDENARIADRMQRAKTPKSYNIVREKLDSKVAIDTDLAKQIFSKVKESYHITALDDDYSTYSIQKQYHIGKSPLNHKTDAPPAANYVIVYVKDISQNGIISRRLTRVTVSANGEILKVSFSR